MLSMSCVGVCDAAAQGVLWGAGAARRECLHLLCMALPDSPSLGNRSTLHIMQIPRTAATWPRVFIVHTCHFTVSALAALVVCVLQVFHVLHGHNLEGAVEVVPGGCCTDDSPAHYQPVGGCWLLLRFLHCEPAPLS